MDITYVDGCDLSMSVCGIQLQGERVCVVHYVSEESSLYKRMFVRRVRNLTNFHNFHRFS